MIEEIIIIKKWLAKKHQIPTEGSGLLLRLTEACPDGVHMVPIRDKKYKVEIKNDRIIIH